MGLDAPLYGPRLVVRKTQLVSVLERLCEALELTAAQFELAKQRYEAVGAWLAASPDPRLRTLSIYLQGSVALGTTVKPIGRNEHDVDLVGHVAGGGGTPPAILKMLIGDRLRQNSHYRPLLEELPRCWRLNYVNEFHQDITPSVPNPGTFTAIGAERSPTRPSANGRHRIRRATSGCSSDARRCSHACAWRRARSSERMPRPTSSHIQRRAASKTFFAAPCKSASGIAMFISTHSIRRWPRSRSS